MGLRAGKGCPGVMSLGINGVGEAGPKAAGAHQLGPGKAGLWGRPGRAGLNTRHSRSVPPGEGQQRSKGRFLGQPGFLGLGQGEG